MCEFFEYKINSHGDTTGVFCRLDEHIRNYCVKYNPYRESKNKDLKNMGCLYKLENKK